MHGTRAGEVHRMIVEGHDYLEARRLDNEAKYHLSMYDHYDWHQDTGEIVFSSGEAKVVASIQMVGDVSNRSRTWLWAWANDTVDDPLKKAAITVERRAVPIQSGSIKGGPYLTLPSSSCERAAG